MVPYSKRQLLEDYRTGMQMVASELKPAIGEAAAASLAWITPGELEGIGPGFSSSARILDSDGAALLSAVYDFAFDGLLRPWLAEEMYEGLSAWQGRFEGLQKIVAFEWRGHRAFEKCVHAVEIAHLRQLFTHGSFTATTDAFPSNCIHLREFAILAGLEEKTVRNMATPGHKQHIATETLGRRTFVALKDALPWLEARGFAPTVLTDTRPNRDYSENPFASRKDLAHFVKGQRERLTMDIDAVASKLPNFPNAAEKIAAIEESRGCFNLNFATDLAIALELPDAKGFAESAMEVCKAWPPRVVDIREPRRRSKGAKVAAS